MQLLLLEFYDLCSLTRWKFQTSNKLMKNSNYYQHLKGEIISARKMLPDVSERLSQYEVYIYIWKYVYFLRCLRQWSGLVETEWSCENSSRSEILKVWSWTSEGFLKYFQGIPEVTKYDVHCVDICTDPTEAMMSNNC
jgi:hypothetical protein